MSSRRDLLRIVISVGTVVTAGCLDRTSGERVHEGDDSAVRSYSFEVTTAPPEDGSHVELAGDTLIVHGPLATAKEVEVVELDVITVQDFTSLVLELEVVESRVETMGNSGFRLEVNIDGPLPDQLIVEERHRDSENTHTIVAIRGVDATS